MQQHLLLLLQRRWLLLVKLTVRLVFLHHPTIQINLNYVSHSAGMPLAAGNVCSEINARQPQPQQ